MTLIGPFKQVLTLRNLPKKGAISDEALEIIEDGAIRFENGKILAVGKFNEMIRDEDTLIKVPYDAVALPGWIDAHTHICWGGKRAADYALRIAGVPYQEIAARGGGILDTVTQTRAASQHELEDLLDKRVSRLERFGITTCEVKSGYGLTLNDEIKMLEVIHDVNREETVDLVATCLAAHVKPPEFESNSQYLNFIMEHLLPEVLKRNLAKRVDIFVENNAFSVEEARPYLLRAKELGFSLTVHADQFSRGGSALAAEVGAISADHLEQSTPEDAKAMAAAGVIPIVLPGATLGLGMAMPPARMLLDEGLPLVIASDWNPGSAPMGNLITQAAILSAAEKLTTAETFASMTTRAAAALELNDRGSLAEGLRADFNVYPAADYREILYNQGSMEPAKVFSKGRCIYES